MIDVNDLKKFGKLQKFPKGSVLFYQGEPGNNMFIILTGKVDVSLNSDFGGTISIAQLTPGNFVGEMSVLESLPRSATVTALEDTIVLVIEKENFLNFITNKPEWAFKIMQSLSSRIRKINDKLVKAQTKDNNINEIIDKIAPNNTNISQIDETQENLPSIFPKNHKNYDYDLPSTFQQYIYEKNINCPVCNNEFTVMGIKITKLRLVKLTDDFREIHENFDKLWFSIWGCPACYYANFYFDFLNIDKKTSEKLYMELLDFKKTFNIPITNEISNINQVFTLYYLALNIKKILKKPDFKIGKIWLSLAWLYQDVGDNEMFDFAYKTAKENYEYVMLKSRIDYPKQEEQKLYSLLGQMYFYEKKYQEAIKYYQKAFMLDGKSQIGQNARDKFQDIKKLLNEMKDNN